MKKLKVLGLAAFLVTAQLMTACGNTGDAADAAQNNEAETPDSATDESVDANEDTDGQIASADEMVEPESLLEEGMTPVTADAIKDGTYEITAESSSSMFKITSCELTVADGKMTAVMTMNGTGYIHIFMGTGEEAINASEEEYIPFVENEAGEHTYTVPVEALNTEIDCTAFSKRKEKWYDRKLLFRADSLPQEALNEGVTSVESLGLEDGTYTVDVVLTGGSGKTTVESPAALNIQDGKAVATIIFSSPNYDYMLVDGEKYLPVNTEGNSTFEIPVTGFDWGMAVVADTIAMSEPHEIEYTLHFDSASIQSAE